MRGKSPEETAMDLVIEDGSRVETVYFLMSEENLRKQIQQPWMSFCSDAESSAPEGVFLNWSTHPRAYGNFSRLLAKYVRDEQVIPLQEAIRRLTSLPADNLRIKQRGRLAEGLFADGGCLRSREDSRSRDLPRASATRHRNGACVRQWRTGVARRSAYRSHARPCRVRTGADPQRAIRGRWAAERAKVLIRSQRFLIHSRIETT